MLKLRDFFHLPLVDEYIQQLITAGPGLCLVAGLDLRPVSTEQPGPAHTNPAALYHHAPVSFLPSGRSALFWILMEEIVSAHPRERCTVITEDKRSVRLPRGLKGRVEVQETSGPDGYAGPIAAFASRGRGLLVIDRLSEATAGPALAAAQQGLRVLSQVDSVFYGAGVARQLLELGASPESLASLDWILAVQRLPALCASCKKPAALPPGLLKRLRQQHPHLAHLLGDEGRFYQAGGCPACRNTGRHGDVAIFDIFRAGHQPARLFEQPSLLPLEAYVLHLASQGRLPLEDFVDFEKDQFRRTYRLLVEREQALLAANAAMETRMLQLEAAHRVLQRRTDALFSLQEISQALIASTDLDELALRVCRSTGQLCGANRTILYYRLSEEQVEVLAAVGWDPASIQPRLNTAEAFSQHVGQELAHYSDYPPGVTPREPDSAPPRAGLSVPLIAQGEQVGRMIVQSTQKQRFEPGEAALLQTFAHQAAVALQRAGLIEQLTGKIDQLQVAQAGLAQKERLEREMELARQVQQSVLPTDFPAVPGFRFAAQNEPARRVGGDFYDIFALDDDHFGLAVADVSDKGMPAALYMTLTRSLLRAEARRERSPAQVVANVNRLLLELGDAKNFVTLFYGVVERKTKRLTFTRAGHDRPVLMRAGRVTELGGKGAALGLLSEAEFAVDEMQVLLHPRDRLVLYTDGLCDILNPAGQPFGRERFTALLGAYAHLPAGELCAAIFNDLSAYREDSEQYDDMTLVILEVEN